MSDDKRIDVEFGAKIAGLVAGAREAAAVVKTTTTEMKEHGEGLMKVFEAVQAHWAALLAVVAGGALFKEAIDSTIEWTTEVVMLSKRLGITTEDASGLAVALHHVGISADEYAGFVTKLTRQMRTNEQAFDTLGIRTKDQNGQWRNSQDVMADVIEKLDGMKAGTDRNVAAQALLGARVGNLTPLLRLNAEMFAESAEKAEKYHLVVGPEGAAKVLAYKDAMADLHLIGKSLSVQIGNALLPTLVNLGAWLGEIGPPAAELFAHTIQTVQLMLIDFGGKFAWLGLQWEELVNIFSIGGSTIADVVGKIAHGDFSGAARAIREGKEAIKREIEDTNDAIRLNDKKVEEAQIAVFAPLKASKAPDGETVDGDNLGKDHGAKTPKSDERLAAWKEELAEKQATEVASNAVLLAEEVAFWQKKLQTVQGHGKADIQLRQQLNAEIFAAEKRQLAEQQKAEEKGKDALLRDEIAFWQAKLVQVRGGTAADMKLRQQINAEILAAEKQLHADERRVQQIATETKREAELEALDVERKAIEERRALRQIDAKEEEAALLALNARVTAIKLAALEEQRALAAGDLVRQAEIDKQIAALKRASARESADIQKNTTTEIAKDWDTVFDHVSNVFSQTVTGIINGTQTLRNGLRSIFQNITLDFLASKLKELQHHAAIELAKRGITTTTAAHKVATEGAAAVKSLAITVATALKEIAVHAARAAAAAFASIAAIPIVGPILAPVAAGVALAAVLALGSRVASAAGGYDIPAGVNPMTQLHAEEMVLPARLANAVRAMADGGSTSAPVANGPIPAAGVSSSSTVEHHYHIQAIDAKSFEDVLRRNPKAVAAGVQSAVRNGHLSPRST